MTELDGKNILLGVTGGIAAYKSADLVRRLRDAGADVRVVMTRGAEEFVRPLTYQAVSGNPVHTSLLDPDAEAAMGHIELARWADAVLIAPASADVIARLAQGLADDLLTTLCLATEAPLVLAPAMNRIMWAHPATQANVARLRERSATILGPGAGDQACGEVGDGRMLEPLELVAGLAALFPGTELTGTRVLITAGPTREAIDPVRYISNRSSGRMGFALAAAAARAGARVTLVAGPVTLATPAGVERVDVESAQQMHEAVMERVDACDVFIACAAVADYRVATPAEAKIKKQDADMELALVRNPDILADVAARQRPPFTVGFAAETHAMQAHAEDKRRRKGLDMIAANWVGRPEGGFDTEDNALEVTWEGGGISLGPKAKTRLAAELVDVVADRYRQKTAHAGGPA
ncbi:bifunctional phosphopantothenoylcysteine decarboxylase/phosphopantothenate--cysteine ligase CoaBC [Aquisalimonas lutea]|uniref:bifunctional phosphopantothenoylcysteine decarboxylase/phosphopantothenate--cysteine ligase CoaBC n=1 Tax=Aquisalimonas lutea TaxID=1327750 RepID=UPI0025B2E5CA|nr:bifunctional phosphopantothenoylcysteine decarboxylase/phosphopantothenate--cysteine ligase CoaBC [Aquisalimonas lutea]MDN3516342.1 bifunctional phosphopantothenoylcysteine decarboxylase/phosphopantothenate--cysteine ligase CoaBC [Aquisalimonas lutea]